MKSIGNYLARNTIGYRYSSYRLILAIVNALYSFLYIIFVCIHGIVASK